MKSFLITLFSFYSFPSSKIRPVTSLLIELTHLRLITIHAAKIQVQQQRLSTQGPHVFNHEKLSQLCQKIVLSLLQDVSDARTARSHAFLASSR